MSIPAVPLHTRLRTPLTGLSLRTTTLERFCQTSLDPCDTSVGHGSLTLTLVCPSRVDTLSVRRLRQFHLQRVVGMSTLGNGTMNPSHTRGSKLVRY